MFHETNFIFATGVISTATPNTNYTVVFVACTMAGCTESDAKVDVNTPVERESV